MRPIALRFLVERVIVWQWNLETFKWPFINFAVNDLKVKEILSSDCFSHIYVLVTTQTRDQGSQQIPNILELTFL